MERSISLPVGISDGNVRRYEQTLEGLRVDISLWNATSLQVLFRSTYLVEDIGSVGSPNEIEGDLQKFCEMSIGELPVEYPRKLREAGVTESEMHNLRAFKLSDGWGESSLTVICEDVEIVWIDDRVTDRE